MSQITSACLFPVDTLSDKPLQGQEFSLDKNDFPPLASLLPNLSKAHTTACTLPSTLTPQSEYRRNTFKSSRKLKRERKADSSDIYSPKRSSPKKLLVQHLLFHMLKRKAICVRKLESM